MKRVLTAVVLIPLVLLVVFRAPLWLFAITIAAIIILALHEYLNIAEAAGIKPFRWLTYAVAIMFPIVVSRAPITIAHQITTAHPYRLFFAMFPLVSLSIFPVILPVIFGIALVFRKDLHAGLAASAASAFGVMYIAGSLSQLISLRASSVNKVLIVFVLFSVWAGDTAAYYVGRTLGKHKLAPIVSPNKSWEGAIASVVASVLVAALVFRFFDQINSLFDQNGPLQAYWLFPIPRSAEVAALFPASWVDVLALGVITNVAAQFGDLFESALKRGANVKDSGILLPGHGGLLDRIDALLFAIPIVWYYAQLAAIHQPNLSR